MDVSASEVQKFGLGSRFAGTSSSTRWRYSEGSPFVIVAKAARMGSSAGFLICRSLLLVSSRCKADRRPSTVMLKRHMGDRANANGVKHLVFVGGVNSEPNHSGSLRLKPNLNHPIKQIFPSNDTLLLTA